MKEIKKSMSNPQISIIIPCYNQGLYLKDTIESVFACDNSLYELIIVNDGSTDEFTISYLQELKHQGINVIFQENKGLAGARNRGIIEAKGQYILPLDSDNKIRPQFLVDGLQIMQQHPEVAVVYGKAEYFGSKTGIWDPGPFNLQKLLISNYIDACTIIRKSVLDKFGYYDTQMKYMGWEDWELWLRLSSKAQEFFYLDKVVFDYRVLPDSMSKVLYKDYSKPNTLENYVNEKYLNFIGHKHIYDFIIKRFKASPLKFIFKLILKSYFPSYYDRLLLKNKIRNGL